MEECNREVQEYSTKRSPDQMASQDIRRRVPSFQYEDQEQASIRVISSNPCSNSSNLTRDWSQRNSPVNPQVNYEREQENDEVIVVRAGNILMEQAAFQANRQPCPPSASPLLPSPNLDEKYHKEKWSDHQPFDERDEEDLADIDYYEHSIESYSPSTHGLEGASITDPTHFNHITSTQEHQAEPYFVSPSSASLTLAGIGRSLQWSQKFPQGRHLSRAKSRTTLRGTDSAPIDVMKLPGNKLNEARAGLRLLAQSRKDVVQEDDESQPSRLAKWNGFKWSLFLSVLIVFIYGTLGLIASLLTWATAWDGAEVSVNVDMDLVICGFSK